MPRTTLVAMALAMAFAAPVRAADAAAFAQLRAEIEALKNQYEARIQALEQRLKQAETVQQAQAQAPARAPAAPASGFNPEIGLVVGGTYARLSQDPSRYRLQGFIPAGDEIGPGNRSFNLGESELAFSANVDPHFAARVSVALGADNSIGVEEAYVQSRALDHGLTLRAGRFLSSVGYLNSQHAHTWDFVDAPLAYQAFFGGQYRPDGLELRWLAPTNRFFEIGVEAGNGVAFPGAARNRNGVGSLAVFARLADDIGQEGSWRAGLSWQRTSAQNRAYDDVDSAGVGVNNAFAGRSRTWILDGVYKWAPQGNATGRSFKLQGEYFRRGESGELAYDVDAASLGTAIDSYRSVQSGWYVQGVYQFQPRWRVGLRYDRLDTGRVNIGLVDSGVLAAADFPRLAPYKPARGSLMVDFAASEFSRLRVQLARDRSRPGVTDNQIFLQYIMNLGAHGAHGF